MLTEAARIVALPRRDGPPPVPPLVRAMARSLRPVQIEALSTLARQPAPLGIVGDIGVGHGKTLIYLLAAAVLGIDAARAVVLVPARLVDGTHRAITDFADRVPILRDHAPQVVSHELLSSRKSSGLLHDTLPRLVCIDEAHAFRNLDAARTRRLVQYARDFPDTRFVVASGTLVTRSLRDFAHLVELALRDTSPLPLDENALSMWASVLDVGAEPAPTAKDAMRPLLRWAGTDDFRAAFRARWATAPGVISTPEASVRCALAVGAWKPRRVPADIEAAVKGLTDRWELPDGEQVVDAADFARHSLTLSLGFYYRLLWGDVDDPALEAWKEARRRWGAALRWAVSEGRPGLDSPALVEEAVREGRFGGHIAKVYAAWQEIQGAVTPEQDVVWLDGGHALMDGVVAWVRKAKTPHIVWYASRAVEAALRERGLTTHGGGSDAPRPPARALAASIHAHGTGANLQAWADGLVLEPPANGKAWEQLLGRTHRGGQEADEVTWHVAAWTWPLRQRLERAKADAAFIEEMTGKRQKLQYCDFF